ncbi:MAG: pyridoxal phosphate-dependent aminotransferase [Kiritimatiellia bacterium]|jgi:alanine-synthesizing transaminase
MRTIIHNSKAGLMRYGIREIVELSGDLERLNPGMKFFWENIGDPVAKGWPVPEFVRDILCDLINRKTEAAFSYTHSRGNLETRNWVAAQSRQMVPSGKLDAEHVVFTNGLGAGIGIFYRMLEQGARIIQPNPGYPAHISSERFPSGSASVGYRLDPQRGWQPDLDHLESQIKRHPEAVGILLINPNNPTGAVYGVDVLQAVVQMAERHGLLLISDEVYFRMIFPPLRYVHITELANGRVPLVVMRGLSKDVPWPGARCGWLEFHNTNLSRSFAAFFDSFKQAMMLEVCATTLPQMALPRIYNHPDYAAWLTEYIAGLQEAGNHIYNILSACPGVLVNPIHGAFYMMPLFKEGVLNSRQTLPISNTAVRQHIERLTSDPNLPLDKRFAFYLLAATGICVVPASDFESPWPGFRITTLDRESSHRVEVYRTLSQAIGQYLASA